MFSFLSRRQKSVALTSGLIAVFMVIAGFYLWEQQSQPKEYIPGEQVSGITHTLDRELPDDYPHIKFTDVTDQAGIQYQQLNGKRTNQLPEDMGSGASWVDYDQDGWQDLYIVNFAGNLEMTDEQLKQSDVHCQLYHNNHDGTFTEVSKQAGLDYRGRVMASAWGDYNNDGWPDVFLSNYGENVFFKNNGDGTFTNITRETELGGKKGFWAGASWSDYDRDGYLDLYVTGYVKYKKLPEDAQAKQYTMDQPANINPSSFEPERNLLYHNNGDGTFSEVAVKTGVVNANGRSLSATWCDFDNDNWPDLYISNDVSDNVLYHNSGNGTFEDISHSGRVADYRGAMGLATGDWDGDQDMDLFITHWIAQENGLYNNLLDQVKSNDHIIPSLLHFIDESARFGLGQVALDYIGWGTSFFDYDNDGRVDLFLANGSTFQQKDNPDLLIPMNDQLFWNRNMDSGFYDVSKVSGPYFKEKKVGRGVAFGDYDNDGDMDLFIVNNAGPGILLRNDNSLGRHWLEVALTGTKSNHSAIGTHLRIVTGEKVQIRQVGSQSSYLSQNSLVQHIGIGNHSRVDSLIINWPSGIRQQFLDVTPDQRLVITEKDQISSSLN